MLLRISSFVRWIGLSTDLTLWYWPGNLKNPVHSLYCPGDANIVHVANQHSSLVNRESLLLDCGATKRTLNSPGNFLMRGSDCDRSTNFNGSEH
jgi:hypothetical protein